MRIKVYAFAPLALLSLLLVSAYGGQQNVSGSTQEEATLRQRSQSYADSFNRQDVEALSQFYADDAVFHGIFTGVVLEGKEEITNGLRTLFQEAQKPHLDLQVESISFPNPDSAIEHGLAILTESDGKRAENEYNVFYAKQDGSWKIVRVSESQRPESQYEHLKPLEWLVGSWIDEDEEATIETSAKWDRYKNFLIQDFRVLSDDRLQLEVRQLIAWDPIQKRIRSWIFDSDGGFGEGAWTQKGDSWVVTQHYTLADGAKASAINTYTKKGKDGYTWISSGREVSGEILPDVGPIDIVRKNG